MWWDAGERIQELVWGKRDSWTPACFQPDLLWVALAFWLWRVRELVVFPITREEHRSIVRGKFSQWGIT